MVQLRKTFFILSCVIAVAGAPLLSRAQTPPEPPPAPTPEEKPVNHQLFVDALSSVYTNNPQLRAKREELAAVDEGVSQALSGFRPNISADYARGRQKSQVSGSDETTGNTKDSGVVITQDIFNGGETLASYSASKERVRAARAQLVDTEQQVLFAGIAAYTDVVEKTSVLTLNQNNVDVLKKQLGATNERFDVGELTNTDVAQAQARLSQAQADERQALGDLEVSKATFKRTIGYDAPEQPGLPLVPRGLLPETIAEASVLAQSMHPTLESAKYLEKAASSDVDVRSSAVFPDVYVQGLSTRSEGGSTSGVRKFDNSELTVNVVIPLYQSGAEWSRIRQAKNDAARAKYLAYDTRDAVIENVTRVWQEYNTAKSIIISNEEAVKAAELALDGVRQENQYGERTILDVLNAEQEFFSARVNFVRAEAAEKLQAYRLLAAVGRLTAKDLALPVTLYDPKEHYDDVKYKLIGS